MGWWSRIASDAARKAAAAGDPVGSELFSAMQLWGNSGAGVPVNAVTAMQHTAVMTCVAILAEDVAKLPINVMSLLSNGGKTRLKDHWLQKLLDKPNAWQSRFEFVEMLMAGVGVPVVRAGGHSPQHPPPADAAGADPPRPGD